MREVSVKTYVSHRMRDAYNALTEEDRVHLAIGDPYVREDDNESIRISPTPWGYYVYYESTEYGRWNADYDEGKVKHVKPRGLKAKWLDESKKKVPLLPQ